MRPVSGEVLGGNNTVVRYESKTKQTPWRSGAGTQPRRRIAARSGRQQAGGIPVPTEENSGAHRLLRLREESTPVRDPLGPAAPGSPHIALRRAEAQLRR